MTRNGFWRSDGMRVGRGGSSAARDAQAALARRMLAASSGHAEARALLAFVERRMEEPAAVGRNAPCPCGSGKKFKQCHGALDATAARAAPSPDALVRDGMAVHQRGDLDVAERKYRDALAVAPTHPFAMHYLGVILMQRQRLDEALPLLERAVAAVPNEPEFHNNLGLALAAADRPLEAILAYRRALKLRPTHAVASNNLGLALQAVNQLPEAIAAFRSALANSPRFTHARWNLALALLANGDFNEGWACYDARLEVPELARYAPTDDAPRWDGVVRPGTTLLLSVEQGLGDAIQFARLARPIAASGMRVLLRTPAPLVHLLASVDGVSQTLGPTDAAPPHDAWLPLLSVAGALGIDGDSIPDEVPYMRADPARRASAARTVASSRGRLRAGIAWAGNRDHLNDRRRSVPFAMLAPLFELPDVAWFSLQKGDAAEDATVMQRSLELLPPDNDFDDTAALVAELDLVISVDTSVAHLAGALARPTWLMLPFAADWRWGLARSDSAWYPTMRLFRQPAIGDWRSVIQQISDALRQFTERAG